MKYTQFEQLPVWKAAIEFALKVFDFTDQADFRGFGDTKNQLERATVSISNNIAEGFERGSNTELIQFLYISKGSAGECRSMLRLCESSPRFSNFKCEISNLTGRATNISKQLNGWLETLKNSKIQGTKFLTQKERDKIAEDKKFAEFDRQMEEFRRQRDEMLDRQTAESIRQMKEEAEASMQQAEEEEESIQHAEEEAEIDMLAALLVDE